MMNNYFIILASGQSKRFNSNQLKQFITYKNKALFEHSLDKAMNSKLFKKIIFLHRFEFIALSTECSKRALFLYLINCFGFVELNLLLCPEASIIK